MANSTLRRPLLGLLALALVALLGLAWRMLDSDTNAPVSPERVIPAVKEHLSLDLAGTLEPVRESERAVDATVSTAPRAAARTPDLDIRGRVVAEDGRGIVDVEVTIPYVNWLADGAARKDVEPPPSPFARARSADDGHFQLALEIPPTDLRARFRIAGRARGWCSEERWVDVPLRARMVDVGEVVLRRSATLRGIVRSVDSAPVGGASVNARVAKTDGNSKFRGSSAKTAADGSFVVPDAPSGEVNITAYEDARGSSEPLTVTLEQGEDRAGLELVLPVKDDAGAISGVVLDVDGTPLAKAQLTAGYSLAESRGGGGGSTGGKRTDEHGRFRFRGRLGSIFSITATHPRDEAGSATLRDIPIGTHELVLRLRPLASATLRVESTEGTPVARFAFRVRVQIETRRILTENSKLANRVNGEAFLRLPDSEFHVEIDAPGFASTEIGPFQPTPNLGLLEAQLEPLPALRGFVVRGREPVLGARVRAQRAFLLGEKWGRNGFDLDAVPCDACPTTKTAADGSFALDIGQPGAWRVRAESAGDVSALSEPIEVTLRRAYGEVRIDLALRGSIRGHVRTASGSPLSRRGIAVSSGDGDARETQSESDGTYAFDGLAPGGYQVRVVATDVGSGSSTTSSTSGDDDVEPIAWDCQVVNARTTTHDIVVPDPAQLAVRIMDEDSRYEGAAWEVTASSRAPGVTRSDLRATRHGDQFLLQLPSAGSWSIVASASQAGADLSMGASIDVAPGNGARQFTIRKGSIRGRLRAGTPANGQVSLSGRTTEGDSVSSTTTASADGTFEFPFAIDGTVELEAKGENERRRSVQVRPGIINEVGEL